MSPFTTMLLYTAGAGACIPLGAALARLPRLHPRWLDSEIKHFVMAFGGGVLIAAVALVLLPQGLQQLNAPLPAVAVFLAGGVAFFALERRLGQSGTRAPMLLATLLDYVPESLALGGIFAVGAPAAPLLAILVGLQNLPEGFNAYREQRRAPAVRPNRILLGLSLLVPIGPALAAAGWLFLAGQPEVLGLIMLFSAGGILYLVFQDIAPQSQLKAHWFPPLGAVCGFAMALLGQMLSS
jgi:zinc transporter, ZIP family